ncbi:MAG: phytanoyl-CoA dioxygenase family protein [Acidimicrobiales bacterium]
MDGSALKEAWERDGFVSPLTLIGAEEAAEHRAALERAEAQVGPLHYWDKIHTVLRSPMELATSLDLLDAVAQLIGPDILIYNVAYIIKEPHTPAKITWHQDLTYWGLDGDAEVGAWIALSPATAASGCMAMIPGSHRHGELEHRVTDDESNILHHGQEISSLDEGSAVLCDLQPGEASLHHGWTVHSSRPNTSDDRRIGLNIQYIAPSMRQTVHDLDTAMLVRGSDRFGHFGVDLPAEEDLEPVAMRRREEASRLLKSTYDSAAG